MTVTLYYVVVMCFSGSGLLAECVVESFTLHSYKSQVRKANMYS